ncbi:MAG: 16S rRNA (cytidine(1402)-2'-O)-methyltransferase [Ethanoligenens sp.]
MSGTLYLVGTPIGNLGDFSPRAVETLAAVDFIAAEDTRVTLRLLNHFEIKKPMLSYYEHNKRARGGEILRRLEAGENCALVSDAGMPSISDPGEDMAALCAMHGIPVTVVPGPCAAITALTLSALPAGRFCFEGFLSTAKKSRREHLAALAGEERTMIFYEAPHKLRATLADLRVQFGDDRAIVLARELTKLHEQVQRMTLAEANKYYEENNPRGEYVLLLAGSPPTVKEPAAGDMEQARALVTGYMEQGIPRVEAVKRAAKEAGVPRAELYKATL